MTNMDKLYDAVAARGPVCVGLDTDLSYLPEGFCGHGADRGRKHCAVQQGHRGRHQGRGGLL